MTEGKWTEVPLPAYFVSISVLHVRKGLFERDDPIFQFWRATAHKYDKFEELYLNSVLICFDLVLQETYGKTTYSRKPASHVRSTKLRSAFLSGPFMLFQHFTDFTFKWLHLEPYPEILQPVSPPSHHPHKTPSLCPFRANSVTLQIQVRQSRVLLEAFSQGLTGEIWTSSPALESIKL